MNATITTETQSRRSVQRMVRVYVDAAVWPYGRMMMCHMVADNLDALHAMADKIGIARRWFQNKPGFPHYDICKAKRELAVMHGAVEISWRELVALRKRPKIAEITLDNGKSIYAVPVNAFRRRKFDVQVFEEPTNEQST